MIEIHNPRWSVEAVMCRGPPSVGPTLGAAWGRYSILRNDDDIDVEATIKLIEWGLQTLPGRGVGAA
jgi:hypothetical protein